MRLPLVASGAALALLAALTGCAEPQAPVELPPTPAETPLFTSEEEALAAAVEVYGAYVDAANEFARGGWQDLEIVEPYVTSDFLKVVADWSQQLAQLGYHREGATAFDSATLQEYRIGAGGAGVIAYACSDLSNARTLDPNNDVVPGSGDLRSPVIFTVIFEDSEGRVSGDEEWDGPTFC